MTDDSTHKLSVLRRQQQWADATCSLLLGLLELSVQRGDIEERALELARTSLRPFVPQYLLPRLDAALDHDRRGDVRDILRESLLLSSEPARMQVLEEVQQLLQVDPGPASSKALREAEDRMSDSVVLHGMSEFGGRDASGEASGNDALALWAYGTLLLRESELLGPLLGREMAFQESLFREALNHEALFAILVGLFESEAPLFGNDRDVLAVLVEHLLAEFATGRLRKESLGDLLNDLATAQSVATRPGSPSYQSWAFDVGRAVVARRPRLGHGFRQSQMRTIVQAWLQENCPGQVSTTFIAEVATSRANADLGGAQRESLPIQLGRQIDLYRADAVIDGLLVWMQLRDGNPVHLSELDDALFSSFLLAGTAISPRNVDSWRNEAAEVFYAEPARHKVDSLLSAADPAQIVRGLPLDAFPRYFSVIAGTAESGAKSGQERWVKGQEALFDLWSSTNKRAKGVLLKSRDWKSPIPEDRWVRIIEDFLDALRKRHAGQKKLRTVINWLQKNDVPRTARMWESFVAAGSKKQKIDSRLIETIRDDLGSVPFTAGLWTTIVARALVLERGVASSDQSLDGAIADGEGLLKMALEELAERRLPGEANIQDVWFSRNEARFILGSYPRVGAYANLETVFNSVVSEMDQEALANADVFTRELLKRIAWAHAAEGNRTGLSRIADLIRFCFGSDDDRRDNLKTWSLNPVRTLDEWEKELAGVCSKAEGDRDLQAVARDFEALARQGALDLPVILDAIDGKKTNFQTSALSRAHALVAEQDLPEDLILELRKDIETVAARNGLTLTATLAAHPETGMQEVDWQSQQRIEALRILLSLMAHDLGNIYSPALSEARNVAFEARAILDGAESTDALSGLAESADALANFIKSSSDRTVVIRVAAADQSDRERRTVASLIQDLGGGFGSDVKVTDLTASGSTRGSDVAKAGARTSVDQMALAFIVNTLLHNADKYGLDERGARGISVTIAALEDGKTLGVLVSDRGSGIPLQVIERVRSYMPAREPDGSDEGPRGLVSAALTAGAWGAELEFREVEEGRFFPYLKLPMRA